MTVEQGFLLLAHGFPVGVDLLLQSPAQFALFGNGRIQLPAV